jgi:hypothetical protein
MKHTDYSINDAIDAAINDNITINTGLLIDINCINNAVLTHLWVK